MKKLLTRTLVGIAYVAVMVAGTVLRPWTLLVLVFLLTALAVEEFTQIISTGKSLKVSREVVAGPSMFLPGATYIVCTHPEINPLVAFAPWLVLLLYAYIYELAQKNADPIGELGLYALTQIYIVLPLALLPVLALGPVSAQIAGEPFWLFPLATYIFLWVDDSGAYIVGSLLGRHKMVPRISPGKTWEGAAGGMLLTLVAAMIMAHLFPFFGIWRWTGLALVVVFFGTCGDLTESLIKRQLGLKDSGHLLPGHGGILDRIDSMLLAVPAVIVYLAICGVA